ncbi:hypothetical protein [Mangrovicoccus sp. HB161399]|uniref:hypothetical protein n=1 Tax=Mangrovicoccus sp. HB161399 TaxID=2720392 RepID=UPI00155571E8|nr:hypothetical protein [Mangrovicoccus sp. HB161399]
MPLRPPITFAGALLLLLSVLAGCSLDREDALRAELAPWLSLLGTRQFVSKSSCTLAVFRLETADVAMEGGLQSAMSAGPALDLVAAGVPVIFDFPGRSPTEISEQLMSKDLARGLGLLSSGIGPVLDCAESEVIRKGIYRMLVTRATRMIYVPDGNALILVYPPEKLAVFMRGNV